MGIVKENKCAEDYQRILGKRYANFDLINPSCTDELIDKIVSEYQPFVYKKEL
ncbi:MULTISPECIES: hypothetical protein [Sphingobacterium]|jgi:hypothetical protein|uniref:hypothetical protein n=1 Tax=Sphingobacterium paramultivorum TaxID=2886510 RepID=UPI0018924521|nr:hypothetical protein [Sphingobacterium paramultivorum]